MEKAFFTKQDFASLDRFYSGTWDKLSEDGKAQMSHRVWEGVRHGEYRFDELPENVKEKESDRVYAALVKGERANSYSSQIPEKDRQDFINAYKSGDKAESYRILDRESFHQNISVEKPGVISHVEVNNSREADTDTLAKAGGASTSNAEPRSALDKNLCQTQILTTLI